MAQGRVWAIVVGVLSSAVVLGMLFAPSMVTQVTHTWPHMWQDSSRVLISPTFRLQGRSLYGGLLIWWIFGAGINTFDGPFQVLSLSVVCAQNVAVSLCYALLINDMLSAGDW